MKAKLVVYWICTGLIAAMMLMSAFMSLTHNPAVAVGVRKLGYPEYFPTLLGVSYVLGIGVLLVPGFKILKEWAYAGFTIAFISALVSHVASNDAKSAPAALVALVLLAGSYYLRPPDRRLADAPPAPFAP